MVTIGIKVYKINKVNKKGVEIPLTLCRNINGKLTEYPHDLTSMIPKTASYVYEETLNYLDIKGTLDRLNYTPLKPRFLRKLEKNNDTYYTFSTITNNTFSLNEKVLDSKVITTKLVYGFLLHSANKVSITDNSAQLLSLGFTPLIITTDKERDYLIDSMGVGNRKLKKAMHKLTEGDYLIKIEF